MVCGVLSIVLIILIIGLMKFKPGVLAGTVGHVIYVVLFGLWVAGVAVCTFQKPFAPGPTTGDNFGVAGNGYFAIWVCVVFSGVLVYLCVPPVTGILAKFFGALDVPKKFLLMVFGASVIEMWHAARVCDKSQWCEGMLGWGVAAGSISAALILLWLLLMHFVPSVIVHTKFFALFMAVWWTSAVRNRN